jgi:hypothetical protein
MGPREYDPDMIRAIAVRLESVADHVDECVHTMPSEVDASLFGPLIRSEIEAVAANVVGLVSCLDTLTEKARRAARKYEASNEAAEQDARYIAEQLGWVTPPDGGG